MTGGDENTQALIALLGGLWAPTTRHVRRRTATVEKSAGAGELRPAAPDDPGMSHLRILCVAMVAALVASAGLTGVLAASVGARPTAHAAKDDNGKDAK